MSQVAPAERSLSMTTWVTSLRNSTGRSKRASAVILAPKSKAVRPTSRPWASTALTEPVAGALASERVIRAVSAPASFSAPASASAPRLSVTTSIDRAMDASLAEKALAPPSSTPSAIHRMSVFGSRARKRSIAGSVAARSGA